MFLNGFNMIIFLSVGVDDISCAICFVSNSIEKYLIFGDIDSRGGLIASFIPVIISSVH